ncbi:high mobility group box domain containing protein [Entamoeba histolytica HM-1:IMSS-B]|uniref:High mobility group (HMG) box domain containing protein n=7 Tax=Entamoeba histolytica TaxID=5759 RepID=C4LZS7_ENTH1|nr:high mobility group (HMG) box domain containing protein [Entamoeba histolytica HM-1:IMSS]EMD44887.1 HMG (high mobility group) box domain containing protein, putative [Entamoeba histolytica KU27]EMH76845.1 high mobility group box domain containing protein [Entamoeba histolytica HM-1:IMSS-B]ENY65724.1 HMG (high mobility group) box domain containing protein [Entamoeba histolytica HM-1:IMSS-A]BAN37776.1 high mobility group (HMG) box domain containing protein [Entamoeba histolytica]EAL51455.1 hi|eukprot:XP_656841.1 high mobility group (HMG) box domain containing protein [Entamoeba histolytica HM-1:IMSS]
MGRSSSSSSSSSESPSSSSSASSSYSEERYSRDKKEKKKSEKKPKKEGARELKRRKKEEIATLSKEIYTMFVKRSLLASGLSEEEAEKKVDKRWKKAGHEVKVVYEQLAYIESVLIGNAAVMKKKRKADTSRRKEDWHPYLLFCKVKRDSVVNDGISGSAVMKRLSVMWKNLSDKEREKYTVLAKENKRKDLEKEANEEKALTALSSRIITNDLNTPSSQQNLTIPVVSALPIPMNIVTEINLNEEMNLSIPSRLPPTTIQPSLQPSLQSSIPRTIAPPAPSGSMSQ